MGQPTPPGDIPLYDGLGSEWNDIVGAFPEDKRAELAPLLKSRIDQYEPLKQWESFQKSGVTPDQANTALNLFNVIENNPRQVYETIGRHLGITPQQAQAAVKELEETEETTDDPRISTLENQINVLSQIALAQRQQSTQEAQIAEQDALIEKEITNLRSKYGDEVNEEEILMRMLHKNMSATDAHNEYMTMVNDLRRRRPAPMLMGGSGTIPTSRAIDPTKLDSRGTRDLVAQMMQHSLDENRR